mmetsp:Transcript_15435/g.15027  ORF Transcript_15435/g.15027 Transcript_15435/m.15027 type:complete len:166 (+) Transcript_15435:512-1009(+)
MVQQVLQKTHAYKLFDVINDIMKPLPSMAQSIISTIFISVVPIFFIYALNIIFLSSPMLKQAVIYYLISFAIGGLLGDVFFHTIPHMSHAHGGDSHSHDHGHSHAHGDSHGHGHSEGEMINNSIIVLGIMVFFVIEKISVSIFGDGHSHSHGKKEEEHDHEEEEK